jgi:phage FluMu protein Com
MFKIRCEHCTRLIADAPFKEQGRAFCADGCRENWKRAIRRVHAARKLHSVSGNH